jgi:hypothetical protein
MSGNPFTVPIQSQINVLVEIATGRALVEHIAALPGDATERLQIIRTTMRAEDVRGDVQLGDVELRVSARWFEEALDRDADRFRPQAPRTAQRTKKPSVCTSVGGPLKGLGICVSVGD